MEGKIKRIKSLLKFYKKDNPYIKLKIEYNGGTEIEGRIIKIKHFFEESVILQSNEGKKIKVFLEDIENGSIMPIDFIKEEENK